MKIEEAKLKQKRDEQEAKRKHKEEEELKHRREEAYLKQRYGEQEVLRKHEEELRRRREEAYLKHKHEEEDIKLRQKREEELKHRGPLSRFILKNFFGSTVTITLVNGRAFTGEVIDGFDAVIALKQGSMITFINEKFITSFI